MPIYAEDDVNDLSDLGIGTSSASGKSSLSEDFDNHSVIVSFLHLPKNGQKRECFMAQSFSERNTYGFAT